MDRSLHETLTGWRQHLHANPELTLHEKETSAFVQARLRSAKTPDIVVFLRELPHTATGKVLRRSLIALAAASTT